MDIQELINGRLGIGFAYLLGRTIPPALSGRLARWVGHRIAGRDDLAMVRAVKANQWVARGEKLSRDELDRAVAETYTNNVLSIYRFYRNFRNPEALVSHVKLPDKLLEILKDSQENQHGLIVLGVHMGNFDLVMQSVVRQVFQPNGIHGMFLGVSQPGKGYQWQNELRRRNGVEVIPTSMAAIKLATQRLAEGWVVVTGLDRPISDAKYRPSFFGRAASLPVLYVPLALRTKVPVVVMGASMRSDDSYEIYVSAPVYLTSYSDRHDEMTANAEKVLVSAEDFIRPDPAQWTMPYPVWPETLDEIP
jgi:lauroyl/myristoyl acyltransferase